MDAFLGGRFLFFDDLFSLYNCSVTACNPLSNMHCAAVRLGLAVICV